MTVLDTNSSHNFSNMRGREEGNLADIVKTVCNTRNESGLTTHKNSTQPSVPTQCDEVPRKPYIERNIITTEKEFYE
jgi:hypothetical protein